jgi:hypothetical protein
MMIARKIGKLYPLLNVLRLVKTVKPLGARQAVTFYTAPVRWLANLGRVSYDDLLPPLLVVSSRYGLFCTHAILTCYSRRFTRSSTYCQTSWTRIRCS